MDWTFPEGRAMAEMVSEQKSESVIGNEDRGGFEKKRKWSIYFSNSRQSRRKEETYLVGMMMSDGKVCRGKLGDV